ncbi:unnamed protein product [Prorocentrum cordatum]|uniref:Ion transport domain-containing protein n=1 Tax=Prorocentrum cordatum TaxID=2364126 RepID=A0ABN9WNK3_9DINO|nr:unnamed protein product [Polarella glacialis]
MFGKYPFETYSAIDGDDLKLGDQVNPWARRVKEDILLGLKTYCDAASSMELEPARFALKNKQATPDGGDHRRNKQQRTVEALLHGVALATMAAGQTYHETVWAPKAKNDEKGLDELGPPCAHIFTPMVLGSNQEACEQKSKEVISSFSMAHIRDKGAAKVQDTVMRCKGRPTKPKENNPGMMELPPGLNSKRAEVPGADCAEYFDRAVNEGCGDPLSYSAVVYELRRVPGLSRPYGSSVDAAEFLGGGAGLDRAAGGRGGSPIRGNDSQTESIGFADVDGDLVRLVRREDGQHEVFVNDDLIWTGTPELKDECDGETEDEQRSLQRQDGEASGMEGDREAPERELPAHSVGGPVGPGAPAAARSSRPPPASSIVSSASGSARARPRGQATEAVQDLGHEFDVRPGRWGDCMREIRSMMAEASKERRSLAEDSGMRQEELLGMVAQMATGASARRRASQEQAASHERALRQQACDLASGAALNHEVLQELLRRHTAGEEPGQEPEGGRGRRSGASSPAARQRQQPPPQQGAPATVDEAAAPAEGPVAVRESTTFRTEGALPAGRGGRRSTVSLFNQTYLAEPDAKVPWMVACYTAYMNIKEPERTGRVARLEVVSRHSFGLIIFMHACWMTWFVDQQARSALDRRSWAYEVDKFFLVMYMAELGLRLVVHRLYFFLSEDAGWNWFDFLIVLIDIMETVLAEGGPAGLSVLRLVRTLKVIRVFRVFRLVHVFHELRFIWGGQTPAVADERRPGEDAAGPHPPVAACRGQARLVTREVVQDDPEEPSRFSVDGKDKSWFVQKGAVSFHCRDPSAFSLDLSFLGGARSLFGERYAGLSRQEQESSINWLVAAGAAFEDWELTGYRDCKLAGFFFLLHLNYRRAGAWSAAPTTASWRTRPGGATRAARSRRASWRCRRARASAWAWSWPGASCGCWTTGALWLEACGPRPAPAAADCPSGGIAQPS